VGWVTTAVAIFYHCHYRRCRLCPLGNLERKSPSLAPHTILDFSTLPPVAASASAARATTTAAVPVVKAVAFSSSPPLPLLSATKAFLGLGLIFSLSLVLLCYYSGCSGPTYLQGNFSDSPSCTVPPFSPSAGQFYFSANDNATFQSTTKAAAVILCQPFSLKTLDFSCSALKRSFSFWKNVLH